MNVRMAALEQVAKIYLGTGMKAGKSAFGSGGVPWVMVEDLKNTSVDITSRNLTLEGMKSARVAPPQTVFFSSTGTIGKVGIASGYMAPSNNIIAVEFDQEQIWPPYGMYCLAAMRPEFKAEAKGAVYDSLKLSTFRKFRIPVPDMEYQKAIAGKLEVLYNLKEKQHAAVRKVKQSVYSAFDRDFGAAIETLMHEGPVKHLGECADILLNGAGKRPEGEARAAYINTPLLEDWEIPWEKASKEIVDSSSLERFGLHAGDIVMNRINQPERLGRCGFLAKEPEGIAVFGLNTLRIRPKKEQVDSLFLFVWLTHPFIKQYIQEHSRNSTSFQSSINKQALLQIPLAEVSFEAQQNFGKEIKKYLKYVASANDIIEMTEELEQVLYDRIRLLRREEETPEDSSEEAKYKDKNYWVTPSGMECYYDAYLECFPVPEREILTLKLLQIPQGMEIQLLEDTRDTKGVRYGSLEHIRLCRVNENTVRVTWMQPVSYRTEGEEKGSGTDQILEENGLLSEQQDFGYIRHSREFRIENQDTAARFLQMDLPYEEQVYTRYEKMPVLAKRFIEQLSKFQQAVYEEFLLAMQPLACHMARKQMMMRGGKDRFSKHSIQDVIATVGLLENAGLLERRQGFYLSYYDDYKQGEERQLILDHRGQPIPIDTWVWTMPEG